MKNSILYANQKAKKSYSTYLQRTLENNWAEEWVEEELPKVEAAEKRQLEIKQLEQKTQEEIKLQERMRIKADEQRPFFQQKFEELDQKIKDELWEKAKAEEMEQLQTLPINVKTTRAQLEFVKFALAHIDTKNEFVKDVVTIPFVKKIAKEYSL